MENWAFTFGWDVHGADHVVPKQAQSSLHPKKGNVAHHTESMFNSDHCLIVVLKPLLLHLKHEGKKEMEGAY